jgi:hypothetical protein
MITADSVSPKASFKRALLPVCIVIKAPTRRASAKKTHERFIASPVYTEPLGMVADSRRAWLSLHRYWRVSDMVKSEARWIIGRETHGGGAPR